MPIAELLSDPQAWLGLATLTLLEIVLGIDNLVFISILSGKVPPEQRNRARTTGLALAMITRILFLLSIAWIVGLESSLFTLFERDFSGRDLIMIAGGLFLIAKSTLEIHHKLEGDSEERKEVKAHSFWGVILQILIIDLVFSLDSVITAVGMVEHVSIMIAAVVIAMIVMIIFARPVADFVERRPTVKMLALSFLLLIGTALVADGLDLHIPKGYIYFAMAFSLFVEILNLMMRGKSKKGAPSA